MRLEQARGLHVIRLEKEGSDNAAPEIELARRTEAHGQPGMCPLEQVCAFLHERVVALAIEGNEAHEPLVGLAGQLIDAGGIRVVELLVAGDTRFGRDDVLRAVVPAAIPSRPPGDGLPIHLLCVGCYFNGALHACPPARGIGQAQSSQQNAKPAVEDRPSLT